MTPPYRMIDQIDMSLEMESVPGHQLLLQIGEGRYGEIWLARHDSGQYRALKIIRRDRFQSEKPFEREFYGIRKYEPVSRQHEELIDILEVGRNDERNFFYYTMELADDRDLGQQIVPDKYRAKTLLSELRARGSFRTRECLELGISMALALACLHRAGLVHRDIKPANIVYLDGTPRMADIGSVKLLDDSISIAGTEGYMPVEGPGRPTGDIFSLGKVLYEMVTGEECKQYPALLDSHSERQKPEFQGLRKVILKACEHMPEDRYQDADSLARDLEKLANPGANRMHPLAILGALILLAALIYGLYAVLA